VGRGTACAPRAGPSRVDCARHASPLKLRPNVRPNVRPYVRPNARPRARAAPTPLALGLLAAWLLAAAGPLARAVWAARAPDRAGLALVALHALVLAAALALLAPRTPARPRVALGARDALGAWLPLVAVPLCYAELPRVAAGLTARAPLPAPLHDATVAAWERALFAALPGASPVHALSAWLPARAVSELLHLGYLSYYALIYAPPAWLWWRALRRTRVGDARGAHDARLAHAASTGAILLAFVACYVVFAAWPVAGPWYAWPAPATVPDGPLRGVVLDILRAGSSRGTAFPSSHVAVSVAQTLALAATARDAAPWLAPLAAVATGLLAIGAMYGGFHWGVDVLAGAVVGVAAAAVAVPIARRGPGPA
jgi:membrane-associated phospholipid phosphatase